MKTIMKRNEGNLGLFPELPMLFDDPYLNKWLQLEPGHNRSRIPAVNIEETDENYEITVEAPGMSKNDFKVELDDNRLVISGEKKQEKEDTNINFLRREFSRESFVRSFVLGEKQVVGEKINAKYTDGILHITVPKSEEFRKKAARTIPIN